MTANSSTSDSIWLSFQSALAVLLALGGNYVGAQNMSKISFPTNEIAFYSGRLLESDVESFIQQASAKNIKTLLITSPGGTIYAGVKLARWVHERQVEVVVDRFCMSACANYVFPAGKRKLIRPGALIVWHGGAEQRSFREDLAKFLLLSNLHSQGSKLTEEDSKFVLENKSRSANWIAQTNLQKGLFKDLAIDEYITRLGQEPKPFGVAWTMPVELMKRFGIKDIEAPEDYGTRSYIDAALPKSGLMNKPLGLTFGASGEVIEYK